MYSSQKKKGEVVRLEGKPVGGETKLPRTQHINPVMVQTLPIQTLAR